MSIVFLTEAGENYGIGHLARCKAISDALLEHWKESIFILDIPDSMENTLPEMQYRRCLWQKNWEHLQKVLTEVAGIANIEAFVVDSYHARLNVLKNLADMGTPVLYMDDYQRVEYPRGIIINPELSASPSRYLPATGRKVYAGVDYMPLREPFWDMRVLTYIQRNGVLVTLGGSNAGGFLVPIVKALSECTREMISVLSPDTEINIPNVTVISKKLGTYQMQEAISKARVIICGGGGTLIEAARSGTPAVVIEIADNQRNNIKSWTSNGFALYAGAKGAEGLAASVADKFKLLDNVKLWKRASATGMATADGQGARRVAHIIASEVEGAQKGVLLHEDYSIDGYKLKSFIHCTKQEHHMIRAARNSESVMAGSFNQQKISGEQHAAFITSLASSSTGGYWLISKDDKYIGVISVSGIDFYNSSAMLGYYKLPECEENGLGKVLVDLAIILTFRKLKLKILTALCLETNIASCKSLEKTGFKLITIAEEIVGGKKAFLRRYEIHAR